MSKLKFYTFPLIFIGLLIITNCKKVNEFQTPTLKSIRVSNIRPTQATFFGKIKTDGGDLITAGGVCWSKSEMPTINDSKLFYTTIDTGDFYYSIAGLSNKTKFYARAFATNSAGTGYGDTISFKTKDDINGVITDIDSNYYQTVTIGNQVWMAENLKTTRFGNGDLIGTSDPWSLDISNEYTPIYQWGYGGNENLSKKYGRLYTYYAAMNYRNTCPLGWHIPSFSEWQDLSNYLTNNGYGFEGNGNDIAFSLASTTDWTPSNTNGTPGGDLSSNNRSGFNALPGGVREASYRTFMQLYALGSWWTSTNSDYQRAVVLNYNSNIIETQWVSNANSGCSIRCVKD